MSSKPQIVVDFIVEQVKQHKEVRKDPLFVGIQGPQGSGKSHLSRLLEISLPSPPHSYKTLILSLDDLYLPFQEQSSLSRQHPSNDLLTGRGPPGTHDLPLALEVFGKLRRREELTLPSYDKSLHDGRGDRVEGRMVVHGNLAKEVEIVIFEGWMVGFSPLAERHLVERWENAKDGEWIKRYSLETLLDSNRRLIAYQALWKEIDCFVQINPEKTDYVWEWRLEQEHNMKAKNGGKGMTDEEVKAFISRYMPSYELFQGGIHKKIAPNWKGHGLQITIGRGREVLDTQNF
ncbi:P-loop containing nucleoside triphosphate hydrolase protein [Atractiella rhizophila]|nr:P-loop containing nucleoside triphosphate hydrolase protein [Atractiella rhizophila]